MANNLVLIEGAQQIQYYFRNYNYANIVSDMPILSLGLATNIDRLVYKNAAGAPQKLMVDSSGAQNLTDDRVLITKDGGKAGVSDDLRTGTSGVIVPSTPNSLLVQGAPTRVLNMGVDSLINGAFFGGKTQDTNGTTIRYAGIGGDGGGTGFSYMVTLVDAANPVHRFKGDIGINGKILGTCEVQSSVVVGSDSTYNLRASITYAGPQAILTMRGGVGATATSELRYFHISDTDNFWLMTSKYLNLIDGGGVRIGGDVITLPAGGTAGQSLVKSTNDDYAVEWVDRFRGLGTAGRLARFTPDGVTLGDSVIRDNGVQVGIGTAPVAGEACTIGGRLLVNDAIRLATSQYSAYPTGNTDTLYLTKSGGTYPFNVSQHTVLQGVGIRDVLVVTGVTPAPVAAFLGTGGMRIYGVAGIGTAPVAGQALTVNGSAHVTSNGWIYWGNADTDGTWRQGRDGNNLVTQRRESGVWVTKQTLTP